MRTIEEVYGDIEDIEIAIDDAEDEVSYLKDRLTKAYEELEALEDE